jgi:ABC-type transport system involved in multi-copper enzyme maturation permease subunit
MPTPEPQSEYWLKRLAWKTVAHVATAGLPLLTKELIEQSSRKRTFVIRACYAAVLFLFAYLVLFGEISSASASPLSILGHGQTLLGWMMGVQFVGVYLFMPAMTCSVITHEKERDSLQLLFLTRLGPWSIILEKLLSRVVPMLSFLLLSLPVLAVAYTLGGVSTRSLWTGVALLGVAILQTGSVAILCSAFFRTTVASFLGSFFLLGIMFFGPYMCFMGLLLAIHLLGMHPNQVFGSWFGPANEDKVFLIVFPFFSPALYFVGFIARGAIGWKVVTIHSFLTLAASAGCLQLARVFLVKRAFLTQKNVFQRALDRMRRPADPIVNFLDGSEPQNVQVRMLDDSQLPADQPIIWRESKRGILGTRKGLLWVLLGLGLPALGFGLILLIMEVTSSDMMNSYFSSTLSAPVHFMMWVLLVLLVSVKSASLIATEKTRQTLEVLCTSPLSAQQIISEKMRSVWRLVLVLAVPFAIISALKAMRIEWLIAHSRYMWNLSSGFHPGTYLAGQLFGFVVLLPLAAWLSLCMGLRAKSQGRAIMSAMTAILAWCILPFALNILLFIVTGGNSGGLEPIIEAIMLMSPATLVFLNEVGSLQRFTMTPLGAIAFDTLGFGFCILVLRMICLTNADRWLGRLESGGITPINKQPAPEVSGMES